MLEDVKLLYLVKPGDNLSKIIQSSFNGRSAAEIQSLLKATLRINPHIKNPELIYPGNVIQLPNPNYTSGGYDDSLKELELRAAQEVIATLPQQDLETMAGTFDLLDWLSDA